MPRKPDSPQCAFEHNVIRSNFKETADSSSQHSERLMLINKEQLICTKDNASYHESVDPEERLMDLHDGTYCVVNPAYNPTEAANANGSEEMLEDKELVLHLMQAVAREAKLKGLPEVGDFLISRPKRSDNSPRCVEWTLPSPHGKRVGKD